MKEHNLVCAVPTTAHSLYTNHSPLLSVDMIVGGEPVTVHLYRGSRFADDDDLEVRPLAWLSISEFLRIRDMMGGDDKPRTFPVEWEEAAELIYAWRAEQEETNGSTR